ncbi:MAG: hypothetical protein ABFR62_03725 [Bacteroidota bacterium]
MKNVHVIALLLFFFALSNINVFAQTETDTIKGIRKNIITMNDGEEYVGRIISRDSSKVVVKTDNAEIILSHMDIKSIEDYEYYGKFKFPNLHDTRYFFAPTAIPIKKGNGYYQNMEVLLNFFNYGITKNISIGGGFEFISLVNGNPIIFFTPKVGFRLTEKIHAGGGVFFGTMITEEGSFTLPYAVTTFGSSESNFSVGGGIGLTGGTSGDPAIMFSGTHRVSNYIALLTENYLITGENGIYIGIHGIRIIARKNAFDIGIGFVTEAGTPIPFIGYVRVF